MKPGGIYISAELGPYAQNIYLPLVTALGLGRRSIFPFPFNIRASLEFVRGLQEAGKLKPLIDRTFPLERIREAYDYVDSGLEVGNVILSLNVGKQG